MGRGSKDFKKGGTGSWGEYLKNGRRLEPPYKLCFLNDFNYTVAPSILLGFSIFCNDFSVIFY